MGLGPVLGLDVGLAKALLPPLCLYLDWASGSSSGCGSVPESVSSFT